MENFQVSLTAQELDDIRKSLMLTWIGLDASDKERSDRLDALMNKLARVQVLGHA